MSEIKSEETPESIQNQSEKTENPNIEQESKNQQQDQQNVPQEELNEQVLQSKIQLNHQELKKQFAPLLKKQLLPTLLKIALILSHLIITIKVLKVRQFSVILMTVIVDIYLLSQLYDKQGVQTFKKSIKSIQELLKERCQFKTLLKQFQSKKFIEQNEINPSQNDSKIPEPKTKKCKKGKKGCAIIFGIFLLILINSCQNQKLDQMKLDFLVKISELNIIINEKSHCAEKINTLNQSKLNQLEQKLEQLQENLHQQHINNIYLSNKIDQQSKLIEQQNKSSTKNTKSEQNEEKKQKQNFLGGVIDWFTKQEQTELKPEKFRIVVKTQGESHHQKFLKVTEEKCDMDVGQQGIKCGEVEKELVELTTKEQQMFVSNKPENTSEKLYYQELYADQSCQKGVRVQPNTKRIEVLVKRFPRLVQCEYKVEHELRSNEDNYRTRQ